ncbi:hypothetical protein [Rhizobium laguerreae]|uniref:hypothetical protein n=1 Tax=Rhizobium laguerreae TaxID=1076926 RepID=UPI0021B0E9ED|nr:hypothetical protein [Rhizobium laguerreae]MBY3049407.1 hypothetical protein [Rhizobium laguerreae]
MLCIDARKIWAVRMGEFNEFISCRGFGRRFGLDGAVGIGGICLQLRTVVVHEGQVCRS